MKEVVLMLSENIRVLRKSKGLSQEELAIKLNVVRQTVSKWEQGLSVPDADMLIRISEIFETPVSTLLGETITEPPYESELREIAEKLEVINLQLSKRTESRRKLIRTILWVMAALIVVIAAMLVVSGSPYLNWDYNDPETAVLGVAFHSFEWVFFRVAPLALVVLVAGIVMTRKKE